MRHALAVAAGVLLADQLGKALLIDLMAGRSFQPIEITGFFRIVMVWNDGVSFGLLDGPDAAGVKRWVLVAVALAVVGGLVLWLRRVRETWVALALGAIVGGALGNVVDRVARGAVADFFDVHGWGWHWPAFNVADAAISLGVIALVADGLLHRRGAPHNGGPPA
ncbi:MAG: signal peptidase II [Alphaproteobacteria bacterium]